MTNWKALLTVIILLLIHPLTSFCQKTNSKPNAATAPAKDKTTIIQPKAPSKELMEAINKALNAQEGGKQKKQLKEDQQKNESRLGYEIDGLLIDETLTKFGHDFYDIFYSGWEAPAKAENFTIKIKEKPALGRGFLITVQVNDETIFEQNLQPNYSMIEEMANYSIAYTTDYLMNYENLKNQIESDDQKGTGLF